MRANNVCANLAYVNHMFVNHVCANHAYVCHVFFNHACVNYACDVVIWLTNQFTTVRKNDPTLRRYECSSKRVNSAVTSSRLDNLHQPRLPPGEPCCVVPEDF